VPCVAAEALAQALTGSTDTDLKQGRGYIYRENPL